ncbi:MAG: glycosyltransferase family 4 protein [Thermomicrobiales bacterium]|nr:glycosyltransferase family 4 protein [Thermomicrobiales bacterium]
MRIGINGLLLTGQSGYRQTGVSRYIERLIAALPAAMPDAELIVYSGRGAVLPSGAMAKRTLVPMEHPAVRIAWERAALPIFARVNRLDLFHGTVNALPAWLPCPSVVTVHDLAFLRWPEQVPVRRYQYLARATRDAVRMASRVIAVSEATKRDIVELLNVRAEKVAVTPLGVDGRFRKPSPGVLAAFRQKQGLERPFFLTVCTLEPRKNLPRLLEAFAQVKDDLPHTLVVVGPEGWRTGALKTTLDRLDLGERLILTGFVPDDDLPLWYSLADVFAFPSLYEGFGLPVLEAMGCGAPVLTSNVSSLPEIAGDAAVYVDPRSVDGIAEGLARLGTDAALRERLGAAGATRAEAFTWRRTAELTASIYREAAR